MIRGAIAFGLVLKIDKKTFKNADIIVTTTLSLVIFTTVFFGAILGLLQNCLFGKDKEDDDKYKAVSSNLQNLLNLKKPEEHEEE